MSKTKALLGLAVVVVLFTVSVTPAVAWFEAKNGTTTGKASFGKVTFSVEASSFTCEKIEGEWQVRSTGKISEQGKGPGQQLTKVGPHEALALKKWNSCIVFGFIGAEITPCTIQVEQTVKGAATGTFSVATECVVKLTGNCELKIGAEAANERLKTMEGLENVAGGAKATANVTGITSTSTELGGSGCVGVKNPKNSSGALKGTVTVEGQSVV